MAEAPSIAVNSDTAGLEFSLWKKSAGSPGTFGDYLGAYTDLDQETEYVLTARDKVTLCTTDYEFTTGRIFDSPLNPIVEDVDPDCETLKGTILVTSRTTGLRFAILLTSEVPVVLADIPDASFMDYPIGGFTGYGPGAYSVFAKSNDGCLSGQTAITLIEPTCVTECGTVFGFNEAVSQCFLDIPEIKNNRWGWTNLIEENSGSTTLTLYRGAAKCNTDKGTEAGTATIVYEGGSISVEYNMLPGFILSEAHVYIGCEKYPVNNGKPTVAPGQYNFNPSLGGNVQNFKVGPIPAMGDVYVIVHGVACNGNSVTSNSSSQTFGGAEVTCSTASLSNIVVTKPGKNNKAAFTASFSAYPVPFRETLNIKYEFDYKSDVSIQFFDMQGRLLSTYKAKKVSKGDVTNLNLDFRTRTSQVYIVKVKTDRDVFTKNIISDK
ncbi:T9SS type A sorting domain-containing protein [Gillisia hiemivivida]